MSRIHGKLLLALAISALAACGRDEPPKPPRVGEVMPTLLLPPNAKVVSRSGSEDALQITYSSDLTPDQMASYYRRMLSSDKWRLVSDARTADGATAMYAETDGPPIWVTIRKNPDGSGCLVSLAGGVTKH